jgi:predicted DNA-binding transcriptional regulator YafY
MRATSGSDGHRPAKPVGNAAVESTRRQLQRLLGFVDLVKRGHTPNTHTYLQLLTTRARESDDAPPPVSLRTLRRDLDYLQHTLCCPLAYDATARGFYLTDPTWTFPLQPLAGLELLPHALLGPAPGPPPVHPARREAMYAPVTLADPARAQPQALLPLLLHPHGVDPPDPAVAETVLYAWQQRHRLRLTYASPRRDGPRQRDFEPHLLFAQEGLWYLRGWCHHRQAPRTLALHRITAATGLGLPFTPRPELGPVPGNALGFELAHDVIVHARPAAAPYFAEREWFPGQRDQTRPDGTLAMTFPAVPRPVLLGWLLYNAPELTLIHPPDLIAELRRRAEELLDSHPPPEAEA